MTAGHNYKKGKYIKYLKCFWYYSEFHAAKDKPLKIANNIFMVKNYSYSFALYLLIQYKEYLEN